MQFLTLIHLDREVFDKIHIWNYYREVPIKDSYLENFGLLWFWNPDLRQLFACDNFKCVFYKIFLYLSRSNWTKSFLSVLMDFLIVIILKNFLIEVDWGQKCLNAWDHLCWFCVLQMYVFLWHFLHSCFNYLEQILKLLELEKRCPSFLVLLSLDIIQGPPLVACSNLLVIFLRYSFGSLIWLYYFTNQLFRNPTFM